MRHGRKNNHLGMTSEHREAMMANMAASLILHKRILTTVSKAKALKKYIEPLITKSKEDSTHSRRTVFSYLQDKKAVTELFREVSKKIAERPGGYTRILRTGFRSGDNADMCYIELVDYNETMLAEKVEKKGKSRRRRGGKKSATETTPQKPAKQVKAVIPEENEEVEETVTEPETQVEEAPVAEEVSPPENVAEELNDEIHEEEKAKESEEESNKE